MFPMKDFSPLKYGLLNSTVELLLSYLRVANVLTILRQHSENPSLLMSHSNVVNVVEDLPINLTV